MRPATYLELVKALEALLTLYAPNCDKTAEREGEQALLQPVRVARGLLRRTRNNPNPTEVWVPINVDIARKLNSCVEFTKEIAEAETIYARDPVDVADNVRMLQEHSQEFDNLIEDAREIMKGSGFNLENGKGFGV